jgi:DNA mismatch endonuclease (patch repair protein)
MKWSDDAIENMREKLVAYANSPAGQEHRLKIIVPLKDTTIERLLQDELSSRGYAYYCHYPVKGQPDISFPDQKIAIFADGCYWHNCKDCGFENARPERGNRDAQITKHLQSQGWLVLRYWEHEIRVNLKGVVDAIETQLLVSVC